MVHNDTFGRNTSHYNTSRGAHPVVICPEGARPVVTYLDRAQPEESHSITTHSVERSRLINSFLLIVSKVSLREV